MSNEQSNVDDITKIPWLSRWVARDFSWTGLQQKRSWLRRNSSESLQSLFRALDNGASDEKLFELGALVSCSIGVYHVVFVPVEWAEAGIANIDMKSLEQLKQKYWNELFNIRFISDRFSGDIEGPHFPEGIAERLLRSEVRSFEWVRFQDEHSKLSKTGERSFLDCEFVAKARSSGVVSIENRSALRFYRCEFSEIEFSEVSHLELLEFNNCTAQKIEIHECALSKFRIDNSRVGYFGTSDTVFDSPVAFGTDAFTHIEIMNCTFDDTVLLVECSIEGSLNVTASDFESRVTLSTITWPQSFDHVASASGSKFNGIVVIEGGNFPPVQFFQEAEFKSNISLNWFSDEDKRTSFKGELEFFPQGQTNFDKSKHAQNIESGCRALRKVSEQAGDVHGEHMWHRAELMARRLREGNSISENFFSMLYGKLADYGLSISRPIIALLFLTALYSLFYAWIGGQTWFGNLDHRSLGEGIAYSLNRALPLAVFGDEKNLWRAALLGSGGQFHVIGIRAAASFQTIMSAVLIYLSVMAVRRKFRIS